MSGYDPTLPLCCNSCGAKYVTRVPARAWKMRCPYCRSLNTHVQKPQKILDSREGLHYTLRLGVAKPQVKVVRKVVETEVREVEMVEAENLNDKVPIEMYADEIVGEVVVEEEIA